MKLLIVLFLLCLLPSIHTQTQCSTKTVFPLIYGRKEVPEHLTLYDMDSKYDDGYLLGGQIIDPVGLIQKAFFMYAREFGEVEFKYIYYSERAIDTVNKVAIGSSYKFGAGKSVGDGDDYFFILRARDQYSPLEIRQAGGDTNSVDPNSEIGKFWYNYQISNHLKS